MELRFKEVFLFFNSVVIVSSLEVTVVEPVPNLPTHIALGMHVGNYNCFYVNALLILC